MFLFSRIRTGTNKIREDLKEVSDTLDSIRIDVESLVDIATAIEKSMEEAMLEFNNNMEAEMAILMERRKRFNSFRLQNQGMWEISKKTS